MAVWREPLNWFGGKRLQASWQGRRDGKESREEVIIRPTYVADSGRQWIEWQISWRGERYGESPHDPRFKSLSRAMRAAEALRYRNETEDKRRSRLRRWLGIQSLLNGLFERWLDRYCPEARTKHPLIKSPVNRSQEATARWEHLVEAATAARFDALRVRPTPWKELYGDEFEL